MRRITSKFLLQAYMLEFYFIFFAFMFVIVNQDLSECAHSIVPMLQCRTLNYTTKCNS